MANEATVLSSLQITVGNLSYQSLPASFQADVTGVKGPTPGAITATLEGTDIDLSQLTVPGLCRIMNLDEDNYVRVGVWNPDQDELYPLIRLLPGESFTIRLDPDINEEIATGTGSGTTGQQNTFRVRASTAPCVVLVEAFEN